MRRGSEWVPSVPCEYPRINGGIAILFCAVAVLFAACKPLGGDFDEWRKKAIEENDVKFTVTFNANGGDDRAVPAAITVLLDSSITLPGGSGLTRTGHSFGRWNTTADGTGTNYNAGSSYTVTGNTTLYAVWSGNAYTVRYNNNGGSGTMDDSRLLIGVPQNLRMNTFTRTGYAFAGWSKTNGEAVEFTNGQEVTNLSTTIGDTVSLYAVWGQAVPADRIEYYWIDEHDSLVTTTNGAVTVEPGATLTITAQGADYDVKQWRLNGVDTGHRGNTFNFTSSVNGKYIVGIFVEKDGRFYNTNITITVIVGYTITFDANGGSGTAPSAQAVATGNGIYLPSGDGLSRAGYTFGGWNVRADGTGSNYNAGNWYTPNSNITLYARWIPNYTITFDANGGSGTVPALSLPYNYNSYITLPSGDELSRTGYLFGGWNTDPSGYGSQYYAGSSYRPSSDVTFYAVWNRVYTVTFDANGGSGPVPDAQTVYPGNGIYLPYGDGLTRTGYTFGDWIDHYGNQYYAGNWYSPDDDVTFYAMWFSDSGAPTEVTATAGASSRITVSWFPVSNTYYYLIYRSSSAYGYYEEVGYSYSTSYTDTGLSANTTYYYKVSAYSYYGGESELSGFAYATTLYSVTTTVTIAMYDSYGDGWNGCALRINVNGTNLSSNATISSGNTNTYTFSVATGDIVRLYWVAGSYQDEVSFIVYYADTPPSPAFNTESWSGSNALIYRLLGTMNYISGGTLLDSFTAR